MKKIIVAILLVIAGCTGIHAEGDPVTSKDTLLELMPRPGQLKGWEPSEKPYYAKGEELFQLIDGGAEIYLEYGFSQAVIRGFKNKSNKSFNLEIYEMKNPSAVYGIYTFKTGETGKEIKVGNQGLLEDYYLNFWKGNYLVTIIGFDSEKETQNELINAAEVVAAKIKIRGQAPSLLKILPEAYENKINRNGITYIRGNLALFNQYEFDTADIFGIKEGLVAQYEDFTLFLFNYADKNESYKWFANAVNLLHENSRFKNFRTEKNNFSMIDQKNVFLYGEQQGQYIFIIKGKSKTAAQQIIKGSRL